MVGKPPKKRVVQVDPLAVTESLGFQTFRRESRKPWSKQEDDDLSAIMNLLHPTGDIDPEKVKWDLVAQRMNNGGLRKPKDCRKRWSNSLDPHLRKGKWTKQEDEGLMEAYRIHGAAWQKVANCISGRTDDQCAKRYIEVLDPNIKDRLKPWSRDEDIMLIRAVRQHGTKWRTISIEFSGRTSLTCRNRWRKLVTEVARGKADDVIKGEVDKVTSASSQVKVETTNQQILGEQIDMSQPQQHSSFPKVSKPLTTTTEWKYSLDTKNPNVFAEFPHKKFFGDQQGAIGSQDMAHYLVQYAKQHGLEITVHQHVHHHYSPMQREQSATPGYSNDLFNDSEISNRKLSALLEPETQLSRYQHFNYLSPLTEVPKLTSSTSPPTSTNGKPKDDLMSAFVGSNGSRLAPLTQAVEMAAEAEKPGVPEEEEEGDFWDSMRMSYPMTGMQDKSKPVSRHHPLHHEESSSVPAPANPNPKRWRQDDEQSNKTNEEDEEDMIKQYGLYYNIYTKDGSMNPDAREPKKPKVSEYDQWGGYGSIIPFNPS